MAITKKLSVIVTVLLCTLTRLGEAQGAQNLSSWNFSNWTDTPFAESTDPLPTFGQDNDTDTTDTPLRIFVDRTCTVGQQNILLNAWKEAAAIMGYVDDPDEPSFNNEFSHVWWFGKAYRDETPDNIKRQKWLYSGWPGGRHQTPPGVNPFRPRGWIYWHCNWDADQDEMCPKVPNAGKNCCPEGVHVVTWSELGWFWDAHISLFCPLFWEPESDWLRRPLFRHDEKTGLLDDFRGPENIKEQQALENFYPNLGYTMIHSTVSYKYMGSWPFAREFSHGPLNCTRLSVHRGSGYTYANADSYALDALAITVQKEYSLAFPPIPRECLQHGSVCLDGPFFDGHPTVASDGTITLDKSTNTSRLNTLTFDSPPTYVKGPNIANGNDSDTDYPDPSSWLELDTVRSVIREIDTAVTKSPDATTTKPQTSKSPTESTQSPTPTRLKPLPEMAKDLITIQFNQTIMDSSEVDYGVNIINGSAGGILYKANPVVTGGLLWVTPYPLYINITDPNEIHQTNVHFTWQVWLGKEPADDKDRCFPTWDSGQTALNGAKPTTQVCDGQDASEYGCPTHPFGWTKIRATATRGSGWTRQFSCIFREFFR